MIARNCMHEQNKFFFSSWVKCDSSLMIHSVVKHILVVHIVVYSLFQIEEYQDLLPLLQLIARINARAFSTLSVLLWH